MIDGDIVGPSELNYAGPAIGVGPVQQCFGSARPLYSHTAVLRSDDDVAVQSVVTSIHMNDVAGLEVIRG